MVLLTLARKAYYAATGKKAPESSEEVPVVIPPLDPSVSAHLSQRHVQLETQIAELEKKAKAGARRQRVLQIVGVATGISSLITAIDRYNAGVYCHNPLLVWNFVQFGLNALMAVCFIASSFLRWNFGASRRVWLSLTLLGLVFLLAHFTWTIVGYVWTWGPHGSECDSSTRTATETILIINLVLTVFFTALGCYKARQASQLYKQRAELKKEIEAELALQKLPDGYYHQQQQQQQQQGAYQPHTVIVASAPTTAYLKQELHTLEEQQEGRPLRMQPAADNNV